MGDFVARALPCRNSTTTVSGPVHCKRQIHPHRFGVGCGPGSALAQGNALVRHSGGHRVESDAFARFSHQVGEGGQRHQLAVGEQVAPLGHAVFLHSEAERSFRQVCIRRAFGHCAQRDSFMFWCWRQIDPPSITLSNNSHQARAHTSCLRFERRYSNGIGTPDIRHRKMLPLPPDFVPFWAASGGVPALTVKR